MKVRLPHNKGGNFQNNNMQNISQQVKSMQGKIEKAMEEFKTKKFEGSSGDGDVKTVFDGNYELISIEINPKIINANDIEMLQDLIVVSINNSLQKLKDEKENVMEKTSGSAIPDYFL